MPNLAKSSGVRGTSVLTLPGDDDQPCSSIGTAEFNGTWPPCASIKLAERCRPPCRLSSTVCRRSGGRTPTLHPPPTALLRRSTALPPRPRASLHRYHCQRCPEFLTITLVDTLAPASLQICSIALSTENPRLLITPALPQAALWWPKTSRRRPKEHEWTDRGNGRRRRLRRRTLNGWESTRVWEGCERNRSEGSTLRPHRRCLPSVEEWPHNFVAVLCVWTLLDPSFWQPCWGSVWSRSLRRTCSFHRWPETC